MLDILNEVQESPVMRNRLLVSTLGQRPGHGTLVDDITIEDPKAYNGCHWIMAFSGLGQAAWNVWESVEATGLILNSDIRIGAMECIDEMGQAYTRYRVPLGAKVLDASNIWQGRLNYGCAYATIRI